FGERFKARCDIDAVAKDVAVLDDDITEIDPDPEPDPAVLRYAGLAVDHRPLHLGGAAHRVHDTGELGQYPVAGGLDDAAGIFTVLGVEERGGMRNRPDVGAFFIGPHQTRVARHISGEDRGKTACRGHDYSSPSCSGLLLVQLYRTTCSTRYLRKPRRRA